MAVLGGGELANTSKIPKSVRVASCDAGPRSVDLDASVKLRIDLVEKGRIDRDFCSGRRKWQRESGEERRHFDRACRAKDRGRELWMYSVALIASSRIALGGGMMASNLI